MEKFEFLFKSYKELYAEGSPLIICARALVKNNENGKIFVQLKFKNISYKIIKAVKVLVKTFDSFGNEVEGKEYQYIDISVKRNEEFGNKQLIELPNNTTRSFSVICTEVLFEEGKSDLLDENAEWKEIIEQTELEEKFGKDIAEQYRRDTFAEAKFEPDYFADIWRCACGGINKRDENRCNVCNHSEGELLQALNRETLVNNLTAFNKSEAEKAEKARIEAERKAEADRIAAEAQKKKNKKIAAIVTPFAVIIVAVIVVFTTVIQPQNEYNAAVTLMEEGKYEEAITAFEAMGDYKDAEEQIVNCENGITEREYQSAVAFMEEGNYEEAIAAFEALDGYKDSEDRIENIKLAISKEALKNAEVGSYIKFGEYEQDNDTSNGKEPIEWKVLDKVDNKILVVSKYAIVNWYYDNSYKENVTWADSDLRSWLSNSFINIAFSKEEKELIPRMTVVADNNEKYGTDGGNDTEDRIFILSVSEMKKYFGTYKFTMTDYVEAEKGVGVTADGCLRTPGADQSMVVIVENNGSINLRGENVGYFKVICPAMWIDLSLVE